MGRRKMWRFKMSRREMWKCNTATPFFEGTLRSDALGKNLVSSSDIGWHSFKDNFQSRPNLRGKKAQKRAKTGWRRWEAKDPSMRAEKDACFLLPTCWVVDIPGFNTCWMQWKLLYQLYPSSWVDHQKSFGQIFKIPPPPLACKSMFSVNYCLWWFW